MNHSKYLLPLVLVLVIGIVSQLAHATFTDVPTSHHYSDAIEYVRNQGIVSGYDDNTYRPEKTINRAEFTKIIIESRFNEDVITKCNSSSFIDVNDGEWFTPYICMAKKTGIVSGYSDNTYRPSQYISFVEAAKIISNGFELPSIEDDIWYRPFVKNLEKHQAIPTDILSFSQTISRGEMAEMIYRLHAEVKNKDSQTYEGIENGVAASNANDRSEIMSEATFVNGVKVTKDANYIYIETNNLPNHETGTFPNSGNPNTIQEQDDEYRIPLNPKKTNTATPVQVPGIALNGVFFEPGTAERNGNWSYEAFQDELNLGLDQNNAHVQPDGSYHYHGIPTGLIDSLKAGTESDLFQVGLAADGFPIWYSVSERYKSSYRVKSGNRPTNPYGSYNGTYTQDFEYVETLGDLDECNGITINGEYGYVITPDFPYITRCVFGTPDESFSKGPGSAGPTGAQGNNGPQSGPPQAAFDSCEGKTGGSFCSFTDNGRTISGNCRDVQEGFVCVP